MPAVPSEAGPVRPDQLQVSPRTRQEVQAYLDDRRLLTSELVLEAPTYAWVSVVGRVRARRTADPARVGRDASALLYRFLHPGSGGPDARGWPFGRDLYISEIYALLQQLPDVDVVEEVALYQANPTRGELGGPTTRISPGPDGLICSHEHRIQVV